MTKEFTVATPEKFSIVFDFIIANCKSDTVVISLVGDVGAGKTTFTQEMAKLLGVIEAVTSPTFTIMKQYPLSGERFKQLIHIDAYRFENEIEAMPLRLQEIFTTPKSIICLEWPERIISLMPASAVRVKININSDETRTVQVELPEGK